MSTVYLCDVVRPEPQGPRLGPHPGPLLDWVVGVRRACDSRGGVVTAWAGPARRCGAAVAAHQPPDRRGTDGEWLLYTLGGINCTRCTNTSYVANCALSHLGRGIGSGSPPVPEAPAGRDPSPRMRRDMAWAALTAGIC